MLRPSSPTGSTDALRHAETARHSIRVQLHRSPGSAPAAGRSAELGQRVEHRARIQDDAHRLDELRLRLGDAHVLRNNFLAATDTDSLVNVYVGAASSEQLLIPNLLAGWIENPGASATTDRRRYLFPLKVPAGTRISATHRSVRTSITTLRCRIKLLGGGEGTHWTGTKVEAIGADTANSSGTYITTGGASEGTLTRLGASDGAATLAHDWGFVLPMVGGSCEHEPERAVL